MRLPFQPIPFVRSLIRRSVRQADEARDRGNWFRAVRGYRTALFLDPRLAAIWIQYGHALKESGNRPGAEAAYRKAISYEHTNADAHLQLGHLLKLQNRTAEAAGEYFTAHLLDAQLEDAERELIALGYFIIEREQKRQLNQFEEANRKQILEIHAQTALIENLELETYSLRSDLQRAINYSGSLRTSLQNACKEENLRSTG